MKLTSEDPSSHILIRNGFQSAVESDATNIKNCNFALNSYSFYMIPIDWMRHFLSYINFNNEETKQRPGRIQNSSLLLPSTVVSTSSFNNNNNNDDINYNTPSYPISITPDDGTDTMSMSDRSSPMVTDSDSLTGKDDHVMFQEEPQHDTDDDEKQNETKRRDRRKKWSHKREQEEKKDPSLRYNTHYSLVGKHAWFLLSEKFGCDAPIEVQCRYLTDHEKSIARNSCDTPVVIIYPNRIMDDFQGCAYVPLPADYKFNYNNMDDYHTTTFDMDQSDEGDNNQDDSSPILLLPPSTTSIDTNPQRYTNLNNNNSFSGYNTRSTTTIEDNNNDYNNCSNDSSPPCNTVLKKRKRYGSGLGNLGNTCFMNSTLQCLAHTTPLRDYFLSGEYCNDLNRDNPLGTGGELASEFASLLNQMWGTQTSSSDNHGSSGYNHYSSYSTSTYGSSSSVVYPRTFKGILGKHAEQFMGYNQHDSQELATYLLDALHEDTNRVTKKPYIEKPEQSENETDEEAASKAWDLHLQRENSRVLESFMGQVKSRVECPHSHCGRVSTTFDPFMYLSVPLPGATDRTMKIIFVPLDPKICKKYVQITLLKSSTISDLCRKIADKVNEEMNSEHPITFRDICVTEMWNNEVYNFFKDTDSIDKIKDSDETYAFQVDTVESIQKYSINNTVMSNSEECPLSDTDVLRNKTYQLDESTKSSLDNDDAWRNALESFLMQPIYLNTLLNPKRNSHEERTTFRLKVSKFLDECTACSEYQTTSDTMETRKTIESAEDLDNNEKNSDISLSISLEPSDKTETLQQLCSSSTSFKNISSCKDVAILEYSMTKFWEYSLDLLKEQQQKFENGVEIQVIMKKITKFFPSVSETQFASPLVLRISPNMTVFNLRILIAQRLSVVLSKSSSDSGDMRDMSGDVSLSLPQDKEEKSSEFMSDFELKNSHSGDNDVSETNLMNIIRQIPFSYERASTYSYSKNAPYRKLGSIPRPEKEVSIPPLALPDDPLENELVFDMVGNQGKVIMHLVPSIHESFNDDLWNKIDDFQSASDSETTYESSSLTVVDCISKYCQKEQLAETDMWYCNKCKDHVRAWKQFHIYRSPPILIIHLKRFHYSSNTHRREKIDTKVDFPLKDLDLQNVVMQWNEGEEPIYDCYAVSNHYGGLGGGHYTAYAQNDNGEWCYFDDSRVTTKVNEKEVGSPAAYVLYYRRKDLTIKLENELLLQQQQQQKEQEEDQGPESHLIADNVQSSSVGAVAEGVDEGGMMEMDANAMNNFSISNNGSGETCTSPLGSLDGVMSTEADNGTDDQDVDGDYMTRFEI